MKTSKDEMKISLPTIDGRPVLLPSHTDLELAQPVKHYHADPRFTGNEIYLIPDSGQKVVYEEREVGEWPTMLIGIPIYLQLLRFYEGMVLRDGLCPHKGIRVPGNGQCPAHGLRFDATGKVIGTWETCYLKAGSTSGEFGDYEKIIAKVKESVSQVHLMHEDTILATNKLNHQFVSPGDRLMFTFTLGSDNAPEIYPATSGGNLPKRRS